MRKKKKTLFKSLYGLGKNAASIKDSGKKRSNDEYLHDSSLSNKYEFIPNIYDAKENSCQKKTSHL